MNKPYIHTLKITSKAADQIFEVMYDKFNIVQMFISSNY